MLLENIFPNFSLNSTADEVSVKMAATAAQNRLLIFGLGVTACVAIGLIQRRLVQYRDAAITLPPETKPHHITQEIEDSLKISTLYKLLDSPNFSIHETTSIIICERALHDSTTIDALLYYITQPDHETREQSIRALTMVINNCEWRIQTSIPYLILHQLP